MNKLKMAYFGAPYFSANFLEKILTDKDLPVEIKFVVTQPDRPAGRKQILTPTPVKEVAKKYNIPVFEDVKAISHELLDISLGFVYAYSRIIPENLLPIPKYGFWNIHPSPLPKYRGPSPIAFPLINGDQETGVTIIKLDNKIDHGPIIAQEKMKIDKKDHRPDLEIKLTDLGYELFKESINQLLTSELKFKDQDESQATYTKLLKKSDGFIEFSILKNVLNNLDIDDSFQISNFKFQISPKSISNLFRGLSPWPGLWTLIPASFEPGRFERGQYKRLKITDLDFVDNKLVIKKVQLEGKKEVDWETFSKAYSINIASPKE